MHCFLTNVSSRKKGAEIDSSIPLFISVTTANNGGGESSAYLSPTSRYNFTLPCNSQIGSPPVVEANHAVSLSTSRPALSCTFLLPVANYLWRCVRMSLYHPFCVTKRVRSPRPTSETLSPVSLPTIPTPSPASPLERRLSTCSQRTRTVVKKLLFRLRSKWKVDER